MAGADYVAIYTNTMHVVFDQVCDGIISLIYMSVTRSVNSLYRDDYVCVGLLGIRFTMEKLFLSDRLRNALVSM